MESTQKRLTLSLVVLALILIMDCFYLGSMVPNTGTGVIGTLWFFCVLFGGIVVPLLAAFSWAHEG